jgi:hypothetical protein
MSTLELITLIFCLPVFILSGVIVAHYLVVWRRTGDPLPLHVWLVTISYNLLVISLLMHQHRQVLYFPALVLGIWALIMLMRTKKFF